jgi:hypothetical protein
VLQDGLERPHLSAWLAATWHRLVDDAAHLLACWHRHLGSVGGREHRPAGSAPAGVKPATLVRDLAERGADALLAERRDDAEALEALIARSTGDDPGYDRDLLGDIDREAWGLEP